MKNILLFTFCSFFAGCASTSIEYHTPRVPSVRVRETKPSASLELKTDAGSSPNQLIDAQFTVDEHRFNKSLVSTVQASQDFKKVSQVLLDSNSETSKAIQLDTVITKKPYVNPLSALGFMFTLGIIPTYGEVDYTFTCTYTKNGRPYTYEFAETTSTWCGWLIIGGKEHIGEGKDEEVYRNISNNLILKLRQDKLID